MKITYSAFILPHVGDKYRQCADRFGCGETKQCFAIADGVGNSLLPEVWASLLCKDYTEHPDIFYEDSHLVRMDSLIEEWEKQRTKYEANLTDDTRFIYEMGLRKADYAASTFVGLKLNSNGWICEAIGDSYLFVLDKQCDIIKKVASMDGRAFDTFPEYFASRKGEDNGKVVKVTGSYENVACFALMTDALSDWFISTESSSSKAKMLSIRSHLEFEQFVNQERNAGRMKDDDTTLVILNIQHDDNNDFSFIKQDIDSIEDLISQEADENGEQGNENELSNSSAPISDNKSQVDDELREIGVSPLIDKVLQLMGNIKGYTKKTQQTILINTLQECCDCMNRLIDYIKNYGTPN